MSTTSQPVSDPWIEGALQQNSRWLKAYLLAATGKYHVTEDLMQEVFCIAMENRTKFDPAYTLGAWLRGIAKNVLRRHFREVRNGRLIVSLDALDGLDLAVDDLAAEDSAPTVLERYEHALRNCLQKLAARSRRLVELHYLDGLSLLDVASQTGLTLSNVGVLLFRSRQALRQCVAAQIDSEGGVP